MGKVKSTTVPPVSVYQDEPDRSDAASQSSAVPLRSVHSHDDEDEFPDSEPPAYEDVPSISSVPNAGTGRGEISTSYFRHPPLPQSSTSSDQVTTTTLFPGYSQDASELKSMLRTQAQIPPTWTCHLKGTHTQTTTKADKKQEKQTITDFDVHLDMTHLLVPTPSTSARILTPDFVLPDPVTKAYRGDRTKTNLASLPQHPEGTAPDIDAYIDAYVSSPHPIRSFTFTRSIVNHDSDHLKRQLSSLIGSTNYRGHISIDFPCTHRRVTVLSPSWQNTARSQRWIRWLFFLTFLWLFSWPYLWFVTRRWEVLTKQFPYSCCIDNCGNRKFARQSEEAFFQEWKASLRRAVLGRKQGWVDEEYKSHTETVMQQGLPPQMGNAVAGGAWGYMDLLGRDVAVAGGWGADS